MFLTASPQGCSPPIYFQAAVSSCSTTKTCLQDAFRRRPVVPYLPLHQWTLTGSPSFMYQTKWCCTTPHPMPWLFDNPRRCTIPTERLRVPTVNSPSPQTSTPTPTMQKWTLLRFPAVSPHAHQITSSCWLLPMKRQDHLHHYHRQEQEGEGGVVHFWLRPWQTVISRHFSKRNVDWGWVHTEVCSFARYLCRSIYSNDC